MSGKAAAGLPAGMCAGLLGVKASSAPRLLRRVPTFADIWRLWPPSYTLPPKPTAPCTLAQPPLPRAILQPPATPARPATTQQTSFWM